MKFRRDSQTGPCARKQRRQRKTEESKCMDRRWRDTAGPYSYPDDSKLITPPQIFLIRQHQGRKMCLSESGMGVETEWCPLTFVP